MRMKFLLALLAFTALASALLFGPAGFGPDPDSVEATSLNEIKKLLASDPQGGEQFGRGVAISGDTAVVGHAVILKRPTTPEPPTSSSATRAGRATGAR